MIFLVTDNVYQHSITTLWGVKQITVITSLFDEDKCLAYQASSSLSLLKSKQLPEYGNTRTVDEPYCTKEDIRELLQAERCTHQHEQTVINYHTS